MLHNCQHVAEKYGQDNPFDIFEDVFADIIGDLGHKRLTRWSNNRLNIEIESWGVIREYEELSEQYRKATSGKDVAASMTFGEFIGADFFTPLNAEWEKDTDGSPQDS